MGFRSLVKKPSFIGLIALLILASVLWLKERADYPQLRVLETVDEGAQSFDDVRYTDISAVVPFETFTLERRYSLDRRPSQEISLPVMGEDKQYMTSLIRTALKQSKLVTGGAISERHFQYGIRRHLPGIGEEYNLVFRTGADVFSTRLLRKVTEPLVSVSRHEALSSRPLNIVMPLAGRLGRLQKFLDMLTPIIDKGDNVSLTLVVFPDADNGTGPVASLVRRWPHWTRVQLVSVAGTFSRGAALMRGAAAVVGGDPLLFFCDVDMTFSASELERCRLFAERGRSVYYPIVFSEYNKRLAAALRQSQPFPPPADPVDSETGDWRDYGFGMSCQYWSDFADVSGQYLEVSGWGGEDVALYSRLIASRRVVRAFAPDLVHDYHDKQCSQQLSHGQYAGCVFSKIANEGSQKQLGMLALSLSGNLGPDAYGVFRLPWFRRLEFWAVVLLAFLLAASVALNVYLWRRRRSV